MRILIVTARYYPEPFTITKITEKLQSYGHEITVITGIPWTGKFRIYDGYEGVKEETINGVRVLRINEHIRKSGSTINLVLNYLSILFGFKRVLKHLDGEFDIVFSHVMSPIFSISYLHKYCANHNLPHMHYCFDLWPESLVSTGYFSKKSIIYSLFKKYCKRIYSKIDLISYASPCCKDYFESFLGIKSKYKLIYQPTLVNDIYIKNENKKRSDKLHILYCGNIAKFNHLNLIVEALNDNRIKEKVIFDVVGSGSDFENVKKLADSLKINNIVFHGRVSPDETASFYNNADVVFIPLFYNSYTSFMIPQKVTETLLFGRPILGMIKGDGAKMISDASSLNIICDQTVNDIVISIEKFIDYTDEELLKCGFENRKYFEDFDCIKLDYSCKQIAEELEYLVKKSKGNLLD